MSVQFTAGRRGARILATLVGALACLAAFAASAQASASARASARASASARDSASAQAPASARASAARFYVGAAKADVTPSDLQNFWLGGYGIGPSHLAGGVLRHIYFRVIAIRGRNGATDVIGALDTQGYSIAYQNGPWGFRDVENQIQSKLGIPASHIVLQSTHTHNGPDTLGVWGGVPDSYYAFVARSMEHAIEQAVAEEQPALLRVGTTTMRGFSGSFGTDDAGAGSGNTTAYPMDEQMRVLQALTPDRSRGVIATLVNYSSHPTVYGPLNKISPDWPGATANYLEGAELNTQPGATYGYPGSTAIVTIGAVGHTWPSGVPAGNAAPAVDPTSAKTDDNYPADMFGNAVARRAIAAVSGRGASYLNDPVVDGTDRTVHVANSNPVLFAGDVQPSNTTPLGGLKIQRADTPPWLYGDVFNSKVTTLRVGGLAFFGVPGEPYPSIKFSLQQDVHAGVQFIFGLAQDQLGYVEQPADYDGAFQCSTTDEWFFTISPAFGADVTRISRANARTLGFGLSGNALSSYGPNQHPSTDCGVQQIRGQGVPLPGGSIARVG